MSSVTAVFRTVSVRIAQFCGPTVRLWTIIGLLGAGAGARAAAIEPGVRAVPPAPPTAGAQPSPPPSHGSNSRPDASVAVAAYLRVRGWLDAGQVPAPEQSPDPADIHAAGVVLRYKGRTVGLGKAIGPAPGVLARATQLAAAAARQDSAVRALQDDALRHLTLELEAGGQPEALVGGTFEQAIAPLQPAAQGLALRSGESWAYLPAGHVLARGMAAPLSRSVLALITELRLPARDLPELRTGSSTALYAVPAVRLVQQTPAGMPAAIERLTPAIAAEPLTDAAAQQVAQRIVARLAAQVAPSDAPPQDDADSRMRATLARLGLRGAYDPLADEQREVSAAPNDQALCAYALARAAQCSAWPAGARDEARTASMRVLQALESVEQGEADPTAAPTSAALALLAMDTLSAPTTAVAPPLGPAFQGALEDRVRAALARTTLPSAAGTPAEARPTPSTRALALAAAAARQRSGHALLPAAELTAALAAAWRELDRDSILGVVPWLLVAERELRHDAAFSAADAQARIGSQRTLVDASLAALVGTQLVAEADPATPADAWGAYPVTDRGVSRVTAQSARAMHAVALMRSVATQAKSGGDPAAVTVRSMRSGARFLAQLQAGPTLAYALHTPERAQGGIMAAPYEALIVPAAQGMALLALIEAQEPVAPPAGVAP